MARRQSIRLLVILAIASLLVLWSAAARCAVAEPPSNAPDATWIRYITREYGIAAEELDKLRGAGMAWPGIAGYLETLYPHEPVTLDADDFVELASGSGITPFEAIETYKRALSRQTDPAWLGNLYTETGWDKIEAAFAHREQAYSLVDQNTKTRSIGVLLSPLYDVPAAVLDRAVSFGMDADAVVDTMFLVELASEDNAAKTANFEEAASDAKQAIPALLPLRQRWPVREFPKELLPLMPPSDPQGAAARRLQTAAPSSFRSVPKDMSAAGAGSSSSIVDPSVLYGTERVSPFKAYFESFAERVDPSSGALIIRQTDFVLPGRAGLDFSLTRVYNSDLASLDLPRVKAEGVERRDGSIKWTVWGENIANTFYEKRFGLGVGWRLAFPVIEFIDGQKFLHMDDGSVYKIGGGYYDDVGYYLVGYDVQDMTLCADKTYTSPLDGPCPMSTPSGAPRSRRMCPAPARAAP